MPTFSYIAKFYIIASIYKINTLVITDEALPLIMDSPIITSIIISSDTSVSPTGSPSVIDYALLSDTQHCYWTVQLYSFTLNIQPPWD